MLFGIDLGGTKIEGVVLKSSMDSTPLARIRIDTEREKGYGSILDKISSLVGSLSKAVSSEPTCIGIGTPGAIDPETQTLKNSNTTCLIGKPIKTDLEKLLKIPIRIANDANCFALAESVYGAGRGAASVFGVILGTGVGGGLVIDGKVRHGAQGIAGEWGHNILLENGFPCYCGRRGCIESVISGPSIERYYFQLTGKRANLPEISASNDDPSRQTIDYLNRMFGRAIAAVINIVDPDIVVLGGGVSNINSLYTDGIKHTQGYVFNNRLETKIVKNRLGDSSGVFGAALLS